MNAAIIAATSRPLTPTPQKRSIMAGYAASASIEPGGRIASDPIATTIHGHGRSA